MQKKHMIVRKGRK